jgi:Lrp/AsnC family leucine-responsive transcriptional regulator
MDDSLEEKVVEMLTKNARRSFRSIAQELSVSTTTVSKIVGRLEDEGIIRGYQAMVDWPRLGYHSAICLVITLEGNADIESVGAGLRALPSVGQVFYTTGDSSFSAYAVCKTTNEAARTIADIRSIPGVSHVAPHTILRMF